METRHCAGCGAELRPDARFCEQCGLPCTEEAPVQTDKRAEDLFASRRPATVEELKQYCAMRGMPLEKMRFFIGEDYRQPKAVGIYRDEGSGRYVVYKNKGDGSRAVRYEGPDEAYAVNEIYQKLLSECHMRGIYPENYGKPGGMRNRGASDAGTNGTRSARGGSGKVPKKSAWPVIILGAAILIAIVIFTANSRKDGYYRAGDRTYYSYHDVWYIAYDSGYYRSDPIADYEYMGDSYSGDWGIADFADSSAYREIREREAREAEERRNSNDDWDDWDIGGTDWGSDW